MCDFAHLLHTTEKVLLYSIHWNELCYFMSPHIGDVFGTVHRPLFTCCRSIGCLCYCAGFGRYCLVNDGIQFYTHFILYASWYSGDIEYVYILYAFNYVVFIHWCRNYKFNDLIHYHMYLQVFTLNSFQLPFLITGPSWAVYACYNLIV